MLATDSQMLPYPQDGDFANGALEIQALAEAIDAKIVASRARYLAALNSPAYLWSMPSDAPAISSGSTVGLESYFTTVLYASSTLATPGTFSVTDLPGYWCFGFYVISSPSGAVTVNTYRRLEWLGTLGAVAAVGAPTSEAVFQETYETNTGSVTQVLNHMARVVNTQASSYNLIFGSGNTGSTTIARAGSMAWAYRVGDLES